MMISILHTANSTAGLPVRYGQVLYAGKVRGAACQPLPAQWFDRHRRANACTGFRLDVPCTGTIRASTPIVPS